jgi:hypothetical protein
MSRILIKFPTRSRHQKAHDVLQRYIGLANDISNIKIIVSVDDDDSPEKYKKNHPCVTIISGPSLGKIGAINRDMPDPSDFDILLLASDDMIPLVKGYDDIIRQKMQQYFPDTDGVLWFNDGYAGFRLNTLVICGSKYYSRFGYIYYPEYKSLFCDNEFMDEANKLGRQVYIDQVIIKHEHPANNSQIINDALYRKNEQLWSVDKVLYESRKFTKYDVSALICTIPSRREMFIELLNRITLLKQKTSLLIEVLWDAHIKPSIGEKRNKLLERASGTYCCFIDDDDKITDDYFAVIEESGLTYDCIVLNGQMYRDSKEDLPFYHSLKYSKWSQDEKGYYRNPNHLNPIKTQIAKQIGFLNINEGEDYDFSKKVLESGLLKTEYSHNKIQYLYMFENDKPVVEKVVMPKLRGFRRTRI